MLTFLIILYMFLYYLRPTEWVPGIIGAPLLMVIGVVSLLILGFGAVSRKFPNIFTGQIEKTMFGLTAAVLLSHISHGYIGGAIDSFNKFLPTITGFLLVISYINSRQRLKLFIMLILGLTLFLAYEGWLQHTTGFAHGSLEALIENKEQLEGSSIKVTRIRWYGVFNDPNDLGLALVLVIPFLLNMLLQRNYMLPLLALPTIITAIYYTNSRGTILAGLVGISSYFVIKYRSTKGVMIGIVFASALFLLGPSRMSSISAAEESAYGRIEAWYEAYQMFKSNPLFGVGYGAFTDYHDLTAHNSFVLVMAELGFTGLFFFIGLFYFAYYWLWQNIMKNKSGQIYGVDLGLISAAYASLTGMMTSMFFLSRAYILLPFMMLALVISITRIIEQDIPSKDLKIIEPPRHIRNILILSVLQIIAVYILVKLTL